MKKLKTLNRIIVIGIFLAMTGCTNESFDNQESVQTKNPPVVITKSTCDNELELIVTYTFDPFTTETEQLNFIEEFRLTMAQNFTICTILEGGRNCEDVEKWTVNGTEYYEYLIDPKGGTASANESGDAEVKTIFEYNGSCFNSNFPF